MTSLIVPISLEVKNTPKIVKDDDIWISDGNLIISVASDDTLHLFKCHKSALARESPIFEGMFSLPQVSVDDNESFEGLPVVQLIDHLQDVKALLNILYRPLRLSPKRFSKRSQSAVVGPLRLATKYEMEDIRSRLIEMLQLDWPRTLQEWDIYQQMMESDLRQHEIYDFPWWYPDPVEVIHLGEDLDIPEILPAAFYQLNRAFHARSLGYSCDAKPRSSIDMGLLRPQDLARLLIGRQRLADMTRDFYWELLRLSEDFNKHNCEFTLSRSHNEEAQQACASAVKAFLQDRYVLPHLMSAGRDPLVGLKQISTWYLPSWGKKGICSPCQEYMQCRVKEMRRKIWDSLVDCFEIGKEIEG